MESWTDIAIIGNDANFESQHKIQREKKQSNKKHIH